MASPIPTKLPAVLRSVRARLVAVLGWPEARVIVDARGDADADSVTVQADRYVRLRVESRTPDPNVEGRGRVYPDMHARISVTVRSRTDIDAANSDLVALTDESLGHLNHEEDVWDALYCFQPVDSSGNWLVRQPIVPAQATAPRKPPKGWMQSALEFGVIYILDLDQSYQ
jgi:hypothetical protein